MAELHGSVGAFYMYSDTSQTASDVGAVIAAGGFTNWSLDVNLDVLDTTNFATANSWKTYIAGLKGWTGTAEQHWQSDLLDEFAEKVIVRFYIDDTQAVASSDQYYYGFAQVNGLGVNTDVDALVDQSLTFTGIGNLYSNKM